MIRHTLLMLLVVGQAQATDPAVKITGPVSRNAGHSVYLKIQHAGNDLKTVCTPENGDWTVLKQQDDSLTIHFNSENPGIYTFAVAVNLNNKTCVAIHQVTIKPSVPIPPGPGPSPTPSPSDLDNKLQNAFDQDRPSGGTIDQVKQLSANYLVAIDSVVKKAVNESNLNSMMKALNDSTITPGALPHVRQAIGAYLVTRLSTVPTDPVDVPKASTEWKAISDSLKKVK